MPYYDQRGFDARFEWGVDGIGRLCGDQDVVVVVDVLSFGTAVDVAVSRGASVFPCSERGEPAIALAQERGAVLAVGRDEVGPEHPYSLSPSTLFALGPNSRLVLPSPNGSTLTALAAAAGATVLVGCLRNARAVARAAGALGDSVLVIAAGERWASRGRGGGALRPAVEDLVGAGAILAALENPSPSPEAVAAIAAYQAAVTDLPAFLERCASGRELREAGFGRDAAIAAELDVSRTAPTLRNGAFVNALG